MMVTGLFGLTLLAFFLEDDTTSIVAGLVVSLVLAPFIWIFPIVKGVKIAKRKGISPNWMWFGIHPLSGWIAFIVLWRAAERPPKVIQSSEPQDIPPAPPNVIVEVPKLEKPAKTSTDIPQIKCPNCNTSMPYTRASCPNCKRRMVGGMGGNLRCEVCGSRQEKGEWEKAMDRRAKEMGRRGFVNLGSDPQCLKCGSEELRDVSAPATTPEPQFISDAADEILRIMEPYFRGVQSSEKGGSYSTGASGEAQVIAIGKSLNEKGGHSAMLATFKKTRNSAHRRFRYTGNARLLEMLWGGIGQWRG